MRNAAMEIYVKIGPGGGAGAAGPAARRRRGGPQLRRGHAGRAPRGAGGARAHRDPRRPRRQRPPRRGGQPGADRIAGRGARAGRDPARGALAPVPGHPRPGRDRRPARGARRSWSCSTTRCCAGRSWRPWAGWPGARRCRGCCRTCTTPIPAMRNVAIHAVVAIEQRATAEGESLDPEVQAALRREDLVDHLLAMLEDDDPQSRRTVRRHPRLAEGGAGGAAAHRAPRRRRAAGARDPRPRLHRLPRPSPPTRSGSTIPRTRCGRGRSAAWPGSRPPGGIDLVAPAHPRPLAGGARGGGGRGRPPRGRGRGDGAVRAARRRERAHPGQRDGRPRRA